MNIHPPPRPPDAESIRVLIRIARAAYLAADDLLLRSAEIELAEFGITLTEIGIDTPTAKDGPESQHG